MERYDQDEINEDIIAYEKARKRVKEIKGFYTHLAVYILVNAFLIITAINRSVIGYEVLFKLKTFSTAFFWGIGVVAHAFSVFRPSFILGSQWEEKKMREIMEEEKKKSNQWE